MIDENDTQTDLDDFGNASESDDGASMNPESDSDKDTPETQERVRPSTDSRDSSGSGDFSTGCELCDEALSVMSGTELSENAAEGYESDLRGYFRFLEREEVPPLDAKIGTVKDYYRSLGSDGLAKNTLRRHHAAIKKFYIYVKIDTDRKSRLDCFALRQINPVDFANRDRIVKHPLSEEELESLFNATKSERDRCMLGVAAETGARRKSLAQIKLEDVDFENKEIEIRYEKEGKYKSQAIPISDELVFKLRTWVKAQRKHVAGSTGNSYLFPSSEGGHLSGGQLHGIVTEAAERAGIQEVVHRRLVTEREKKQGKSGYVEEHRVTPHLLRHTFSHIMDQAGLSTEARSDLLNHTSIEVTQRIYTHTKGEYKSLLRDRLYDN